jgi:hypothetical protein
VLQRRHH